LLASGSSGGLQPTQQGEQRRRHQWRGAAADSAAYADPGKGPLARVSCASDQHVAEHTASRHSDDRSPRVADG
jgi:hypothetical protein